MFDYMTEIFTQPKSLRMFHLDIARECMSGEYINILGDCCAKKPFIPFYMLF